MPLRSMRRCGTAAALLLAAAVLLTGCNTTVTGTPAASGACSSGTAPSGARALSVAGADPCTLLTAGQRRSLGISAHVDTSLPTNNASSRQYRASGGYYSVLVAWDGVDSSADSLPGATRMQVAGYAAYASRMNSTTDDSCALAVGLGPSEILFVSYWSMTGAGLASRQCTAAAEAALSTLKGRATR